MPRRHVVVGLALAVASLLSTAATAQSIGIGPRFSMVRGDLLTNTPPSRFIGGTVRMVTGHHSVIEASMDYRSYVNEAGTERVRERPLQGSLLLFPVRAAFAPYVGGGIGLYTQYHDAIDSTGLVTLTTVEKKVGWHVGVGAEIRIARHAAFFADYRFRFVRFGAPQDVGSEPINVPGIDQIKLSHQGSMWTGGLAFYF